MPIPFLTNELFELSDKIYPYVEDDVIIIDDVYKNFDQIAFILENSAWPNWKINNNSRNFKDYYDCRGQIKINRPSKKTLSDIETISNLIKFTYSVKNVTCLNESTRKFNIFKHINLPNPDKDMQMYPHIDSKFSAITSFDSICSGGTAVYDLDSSFRNEEMDKEMEYLFCDVSNFSKKVIQSKPNRMIIFKASQYHGGYINDHKKYLNDWRMNEVLFFD